MTAEPDNPDEEDRIIAALLIDPGPVTPLATIWATVDRERARSAVGGIAEELPGDEHLGAWVTLLAHDAAHEPPIALLEPSTEGRLAAWLARNGEGPAGRYVGVDGAGAFDGLASRAAALGLGVTPVAGGPFGPSRLVIGRSRSAPNLVLVDRRAGTIGR
jgi:hypothetical protein